MAEVLTLIYPRGNLNGVPASWLYCGTAMVVTDIWGSEAMNEDLT